MLGRTQARGRLQLDRPILNSKKRSRPSSLAATPGYAAKNRRLIQKVWRDLRPEVKAIRQNVSPSPQVAVSPQNFSLLQGPFRFNPSQGDLNSQRTGSQIRVQRAMWDLMLEVDDWTDTPTGPPAEAPIYVRVICCASRQFDIIPNLVAAAGTFNTGDLLNSDINDAGHDGFAYFWPYPDQTDTSAQSGRAKSERYIVCDMRFPMITTQSSYGISGRYPNSKRFFQKAIPFPRMETFKGTDGNTGQYAFSWYVTYFSPYRVNDGSLTVNFRLTGRWAFNFTDI